LLLQLQELSFKFPNSQNFYKRQLNSREESSQKYFENDFTNVDLCENVERDNFVDSFDNFLPPKPNESPETASNVKPKAFLYDEAGEQIDQDFQRAASNRLTKQQLLLFKRTHVLRYIVRKKLRSLSNQFTI